MELIYRGAEAELYKSDFMGIRVVIKRRVSKGYRAPELDRALRIARTRKEARLMRRARLAGVPVPIILDVWEDSIMMEYVPGVRMADSISEESMLALGIAACRLHGSKIAHNDLTPYNALITEEGGVCLLDFGLAEYTHDVESYAVDLYVLKRSLKSITEDWKELWDSFLRGYSTCGFAERVIRRLELVEERGRYK